MTADVAFTVLGDWLRPGDLVRQAGGTWHHLGVNELEQADPLGEWELSWPDDLLTLAEIKERFETPVGAHSVRVHAGHPMFCQDPEPHWPHVHRYAYIRDVPTIGARDCDGVPLNWTTKPNPCLTTHGVNEERDTP